jgi:hypothetical protein
MKNEYEKEYISFYNQIEVLIFKNERNLNPYQIASILLTQGSYLVHKYRIMESNDDIEDIFESTRLDGKELAVFDEKENE